GRLADADIVEGDADDLARAGLRRQPDERVRVEQRDARPARDGVPGPGHLLSAAGDEGIEALRLRPEPGIGIERLQRPGPVPDSGDQRRPAGEIDGSELHGRASSPSSAAGLSRIMVVTSASEKPRPRQRATTW